MTLRVASPLYIFDFALTNHITIDYINKRRLNCLLKSKYICLGFFVAFSTAAITELNIPNLLQWMIVACHPCVVESTLEN